MESKQADLFKVLGVDKRIRIIELLKEKGPLGANEMSEILGITPSAVSQHLKILKHAGLVRNERKGYWIPYEINSAALEKCGEFLSSVCTCGCKGNGKFREAELNNAGDEDKIALLEKYEKELQEELSNIQIQLEKLKRKT
jgi:DNA-binding transcriptional ArsR family regulator